MSATDFCSCLALYWVIVAASASFLAMYQLRESRHKEMLEVLKRRIGISKHAGCIGSRVLTATKCSIPQHPDAVVSTSDRSDAISPVRVHIKLSTSSATNRLPSALKWAPIASSARSLLKGRS